MNSGGSKSAICMYLKREGPPQGMPLRKINFVYWFILHQRRPVLKSLKCSVSDPDSFYTDPDPGGFLTGYGTSWNFRYFFTELNCWIVKKNDSWESKDLPVVLYRYSTYGSVTRKPILIRIGNSVVKNLIVGDNLQYPDRGVVPLCKKDLDNILL